MYDTEFNDKHMDEINEMREKIQNRSRDERLEQELDELEYDAGISYDMKGVKK